MRATLQPLIDQHDRMIRSVLALMVDRYDRRPDDPWLDMKINLITGEDRAADDPLCGYGVINGWIQGRGIEALTGHAQYLRDFGDGDNLLPRIEAMMRRLLAQLRTARDANGGHLFFFMTPDGQPMACDAAGTPQPAAHLTADSPHNATDMFASKGMYAAALYLGDDDAAAEAKAYVLAVNDAIINRAFVTDQQALDPKNAVRPVPGRHSHGPRMIQIGAAAVMLRYEQSDEALSLGLDHMDYILDHHVNLMRWDDLEPWDFVEFINDAGEPYREGGKVFCDPGHALEFVGLTLKCTTTARQLGMASDRITRVEESCLPILLKNFDSGYQPAGGGVCKLYDLAGREPINTDMPWWSLPETIRAAAYCMSIAETEGDRDAAMKVLTTCHDAFVTNYVKPEMHMQAVQTRDAAGNVVNVIPATPDADPGYHTGLSLIDAVRALRDF